MARSLDSRCCRATLQQGVIGLVASQCITVAQDDNVTISIATHATVDFGGGLKSLWQSNMTGVLCEIFANWEVAATDSSGTRAATRLTGASYA
jgi:hypothetical protein